MKKLFTFTKTILVAAGLCAGMSAWGEATITTTTYDFTSMGNVTISSLTGSNIGKARGNDTKIPDDAVGTDVDKMNSKIGFNTAVQTLSSTNGLYFTNNAYMSVLGLQEGDIFIATFSGANFKAVNCTSGTNTTTDTKITYLGTQLSVWDNLTSGEYYFAMSTTHLAFHTRQYLKISNITIKHNDSDEYLKLFRMFKIVAQSTYSNIMTFEIAAAKLALVSGSTDESVYSTAYDVLKSAYESKCVASRNDTYKVTAGEVISCGDVIGIVYGVTLTYGGKAGTNTWTASSTSQSGLKDLGYTASATTNAYPQKSNGGRTADPKDPPTQGNFWKFTTTVAGELEFAGLFSANRNTYCGPSDGSESTQSYNPGESNMYGSHTFSLSANKTYYIWTDNAQYGLLAGFKYIPADETATLGTNGYATFASSYPLDLTTANLPTGLTAYKASVSGTTVTFTALDQTVPANTGILLKGEASATVNIPVAASGTEVTENAFLVNTSGSTFTDEDANSYYYFGLVKNTLTFGTFDPSSVAIPASKAYLKVLKSSVGNTSGARLTLVFDNEATGVSTIQNAQSSMRNDIYNLQGQRVGNPTKGLYIVNGKKVIVK